MGSPAGRFLDPHEMRDSYSENAMPPTPTRKDNNVRKIRLAKMMSKAELARRAGVSTLTIDRIEKNFSCRMDTKRKILEALQLTTSDRITVFGADETE